MRAPASQSIALAEWWTQEGDAVEGTMEPILHEIGEQHDFHDLQRERLRSDR
jgi:hypothetical protein